jgi:hypothetical protein
VERGGKQRELTFRKEEKYRQEIGKREREKGRGGYIMERTKRDRRETEIVCDTERERKGEERPVSKK